MSKQAVLDFRKAVNESDELQSKIRTSGGRNLVGIGAEAGFDFTVEELNEVAGEVGEELSDFELEMVSGGGLDLEVTSTSEPLDVTRSYEVDSSTYGTDSSTYATC